MPKWLPGFIISLISPLSIRLILSNHYSTVPFRGFLVSSTQPLTYTNPICHSFINGIISASCLLNPTESLTSSTFKYITNTATTHQLHCSYPAKPTFSLVGCESSLQNGLLQQVAPLMFLKEWPLKIQIWLFTFLKTWPLFLITIRIKYQIFLPIPFQP